MPSQVSETIISITYHSETIASWLSSYTVTNLNHLTASGMGLLASCYSDDTERGKVMGMAIAGLSLGITGLKNNCVDVSLVIDYIWS